MSQSQSQQSEPPPPRRSRRLVLASQGRDIHNYRHQVEVMIGNKNYAGLVQMICERQHEHEHEHEHEHQEHEQATTTATTNINTLTPISRISIEEIVETILATESLPVRLLMNRGNNKSAEPLFLVLLALAGEKFVMDKFVFLNRKRGVHRSIEGWTLLHYACMHGTNVSIDVVSKLVEVGGKDLIFSKDEYGRSPLHFAAECDKSYHVSKLLEVGGRDLVLVKDNDGWNPLHRACSRYNISIDVVSKLVEVGGRDLVLAKGNDGRNSLHIVCSRNARCIDVVSQLVEVGGRDLVLAKDEYGHSTLHCALDTYASIDVAPKLVEVAGSEVLMQVNQEGETPLISAITRSQHSFNETTVLFFITKGMELQIGGEYAIGGLFNCHINQKVKDTIYKCWGEKVLPPLEQAMELSQNRHQPIAQAVIMDKAPPHVIKDVVNRFSESINTIDSFGRYPIDFAVRHGLAWNDGMKDIVETFVAAQQTTTFHVCIKHGVQWENGTKDALGGSDDSIVEREDVSTGLYPFMVAALGEKYGYDLDSIFHLIKASPKLVQLQHGVKCGEEQLSRKRKRN